MGLTDGVLDHGARLELRLFEPQARRSENDTCAASSPNSRSITTGSGLIEGCNCIHHA